MSVREIADLAVREPRRGRRFGDFAGGTEASELRPRDSDGPDLEGG